MCSLFVFNRLRFKLIWPENDILSLNILCQNLTSWSENFLRPLLWLFMRFKMESLAWNIRFDII